MSLKVLLKTITSLGVSFLLTIVITKFVFYPESPEVRTDFSRIFERVASPIIGSKGEPVEAGVDVTPPPSIYY